MSFSPANAIEVFKSAITKQFWDVNGRTSRSDYWHFFAVMIALYIGFMILSMIPKIGGIFYLLYMLISLALLAPGIGMAIRRMHDVGKAWWFGLIPIYNLILALTGGDKGENQYGPDPLA